MIVPCTVDLDVAPKKSLSHNNNTPLEGREMEVGHHVSSTKPLDGVVDSVESLRA